MCVCVCVSSLFCFGLPFSNDHNGVRTDTWKFRSCHTRGSREPSLLSLFLRVSYRGLLSTVRRIVFYLYLQSQCQFTQALPGLNVLTAPSKSSRSPSSFRFDSNQKICLRYRIRNNFFVCYEYSLEIHTKLTFKVVETMGPIFMIIIDVAWPHFFYIVWYIVWASVENRKFYQTPFFFLERSKILDSKKNDKSVEFLMISETRSLA